LFLHAPPVPVAPPGSIKIYFLVRPSSSVQDCLPPPLFLGPSSSLRLRRFRSAARPLCLIESFLILSHPVISRFFPFCGWNGNLMAVFSLGRLDKRNLWLCFLIAVYEKPFRLFFCHFFEWRKIFLHFSHYSFDKLLGSQSSLDFPLPPASSAFSLDVKGPVPRCRYSPFWRAVALIVLFRAPDLPVPLFVNMVLPSGLSVPTFIYLSLWFFVERSFDLSLFCRNSLPGLGRFGIALVVFNRKA